MEKITRSLLIIVVMLNCSLGAIFSLASKLYVLCGLFWVLAFIVILVPAYLDKRKEEKEVV